MLRIARALLPLLLLPVLLTGCDAAEKGGTEGAAADLDDAARAWGVAPELVYVTEVSGFTVFQESVGEYGDGEFVAAYRSEESAARFGLFVDRRTLTAENCPEQPMVEGSDERVSCDRDGDAWYRKTGDHHEYAVPGDDGVVVRLSADEDGVDRATLRKAAEAPHRPDGAELGALLQTTGVDS
ncbi:hypothetical protein ACLVWQ_16165 [Streptomyces sp. CWNU-52B]|uniref:hypothetical protein n=1 Tax=unclassified Streptomyces TaxID=2593676 RepID=UPI0039C2D33D